MNRVCILGGGPAGACAALAALQEGSRVAIVERSHFPRHKVCGEFLSPEIESVLRRLDVWAAFQSAGPAPIRRMALYFGDRSVESKLPAVAWGLSRYVYDNLLLGIAHARGATVTQDADDEAHVIASGRSIRNSPEKGSRLFGWKAHFRGGERDAVELYFFENCYVGLNTVEGGLINVCGLGPEKTLRDVAFDIDRLLARCPPLMERLQRSRRCWSWLHVGPLVFQHGLRRPAADRYPAGDALSFVDPFTGSGLLAAALTGELAGRCAARRISPSAYIEQCRSILESPFGISSVLRGLARSRAAEVFAPWVPAGLLFRLTRPRAKTTRPSAG